ncbi:MAG: thioredoxin fold domain-containing protein [Xanthomonadales bacterium]|nr:thioredoxin fold domain-containing protein [Xanthomonadales bacterium]
MKKILWMALCVLLAGASQADEFEAVRKAIKSLAPNVTIDEVKPAPFEGFAEVLLGAQLLYVSEDGRYLIDGTVIDVQNGRNLSELSRGAVRKEKLGELPGAELISFKATTETRHQITVFTDIDCGYCRRLHEQMGQYNELGIEVNYLFFPRAGVGSASFQKAVSVWCADDQNSAMTAAKAGQEVEPKQCTNPVEAHYELGRQLGVTGTPALVSSNGTLIPGYVPPAALLGQLNNIE